MIGILSIMHIIGGSSLLKKSGTISWRSLHSCDCTSTLTHTQLLCPSPVTCLYFRPHPETTSILWIHWIPWVLWIFEFLGLLWLLVILGFLEFLGLLGLLRFFGFVGFFEFLRLLDFLGLCTSSNFIFFRYFVRVSDIWWIQNSMKLDTATTYDIHLLDERETKMTLHTLSHW
jgi:hypothetical protein